MKTGKLFANREGKVKKDHWILRLVKHQAWDIFPLIALIGGTTPNSEWVLGVGAVLWFGTIIIRWSS